MLSVIVAADEQGGIGFKGRLLAHLPRDMAYFKRTTMGHPVIMGRNTYDSLPVKPLPGRKNIVVSTSLNELARDCIIARSPDEALTLCAGDDAFVIGGMQIYRQMLPYSGCIYLTRIHHVFEADAFFQPPSDGWCLFSSERHEADERNAYALTFEVWKKTREPKF